MTRCTLHIFGAGQYNRGAVQRPIIYASRILSSAIHTSGIYKSVSSGIRLTEKQVLMNGNLTLQLEYSER